MPLVWHKGKELLVQNLPKGDEFSLCSHFGFAKLRLCLQVPQLLWLQYPFIFKTAQMNKTNILQRRHALSGALDLHVVVFPLLTLSTWQIHFCSQIDSYWHGTPPGWENTLFGILEAVQWYLWPGTPNQGVSSEAAASHSCKLLHKVLPWAGRRCWTSPAVVAGHRDAAPEAAAPCPG